MNNRHCSLSYILLVYSTNIMLVSGGIGNPSPNPPTSETVGKSDAIVEGSFILDQIPQGTADNFTSHKDQKIAGTTFMAPFKVEGAPKGAVDKTINVKLFYPSDPNNVTRWLLPTKEKLLLFLKKDPSGQSFYLVDPWSSWLIITGAQSTGAGPNDSGATAPNAAIVKDVTSFLTYYLAHPEAKFQYPYAPSFQKADVLTYPATDPSIIRALQVGKSLGSTDKEFIEIAQKYIDQPGEAGLIARTIVTSSGNYQNELQRLSNYGNMSNIDKWNLRGELYAAIRDSSDLSKMTPLISSALSSPDPQMRLFIARGLNQNKTKGKDLYTQVVPLLDDPDQEIQYQAVGCIFGMSGSIKQPVATREVHLPAYTVFQKTPSVFIKQCKDWWDKHKDSLQ
jgi:hypothetical protein